MNDGIGKQEWEEYKRRANKGNKRVSPAKIKREKIERQAEIYANKMHESLERRDYNAAANYMSLLKLYTYKLQTAMMDEFLEGM